ncbi:MAG: hypothetical protein EOM14_10165 [Clostridia bacterium]|nr:hypothetical protein [Clostridia bacterium]
MRVKLRGRLASPTINAGAGEIIDVTDEMGYQLISNGGAELVQEVKAPKVIETASLDKTIETAAKPKPIKKKR